MPKPNENQVTAGKNVDVDTRGSEAAVPKAPPLDDEAVEQPQGGGSFIRCPTSGALTRAEADQAPDAV